MAKAIRDIPKALLPNGRGEKAAVVSSVKEYPFTEEGFLSRFDTITKPVIAHIITVSQKVALIDIKACLEGCGVLAPAAAIAAEPRPDSFVNNPRAIPYLAAILRPPPIKPPATAAGSLEGRKAEYNIICKLCNRKLRFIINIIIQAKR